MISNLVFSGSFFTVRRSISGLVACKKSYRAGRKSYMHAVQNPDKQVKIQLTEKEAELFSILRQIVQDYNSGTTVRVAGGWVRDKASLTAPTMCIMIIMTLS